MQKFAGATCERHSKFFPRLPGCAGRHGGRQTGARDPWRCCLMPRTTRSTSGMACRRFKTCARISAALRSKPSAITLLRRTGSWSASALPPFSLSLSSSLSLSLSLSVCLSVALSLPLPLARVLSLTLRSLLPPATMSVSRAQVQQFAKNAQGVTVSPKEAVAEANAVFKAAPVSASLSVYLRKCTKLCTAHTHIRAQTHTHAHTHTHTHTHARTHKHTHTHTHTHNVCTRTHTHTHIMCVCVCMCVHVHT